MIIQLGSMNATSGSLYRLDVILCKKCYFPDSGLSTTIWNTGEVILQIASSLCLTPLYDVTNTDKKQPYGSHQLKVKKTRQIDILWSELTYLMDCMQILKNNWKLKVSSSTINHSRIIHSQLYTLSKGNVLPIKLCMKDNQLHVIKQDMDVNGHQRLSNITIRHRLK